MAAIAGIKLPDEINKSIDLADNALLFYTEHTTGYSESVREPFSQPTMEQRALKESYAWEANRRAASIGEEAMGLLQSKFNREKEPSLIVFNTLNWKRSGLTTVYIDHQIVPRDKTAGIFDHEGNRCPFSRFCRTVRMEHSGLYGLRMFRLSDIKNILSRPLSDDKHQKSRLKRRIFLKTNGIKLLLILQREQ